MALQDIVVPPPGRWRWHGVQGVTNTYQLLSPDGSCAGTWWGEAQPDGMYGLLCDLAVELNDREPTVCPMCHGDSDHGQPCHRCIGEHR